MTRGYPHYKRGLHLYRCATGLEAFKVFKKLLEAMNIQHLNFPRLPNSCVSEAGGSGGGPGGADMGGGGGDNSSSNTGTLVSSSSTAEMDVVDNVVVSSAIESSLIRLLFLEGGLTFLLGRLLVM